MEKKRETKTIYRLVPCPQYDLSGMEHWLSDMAQNGWLLQKEGITFGIAGFDFQPFAEALHVMLDIHPLAD